MRMLTICYLLVTLACTAKSEELAPKFQLRVLQKERGSARLVVQLTNQSGQDVSVYASKLPLTNRYAMTILATKRSAPTTVLREVFEYDDPTPAIVTFKSNETRQGTFDLAERFPEIESVLSREPVFVFWTFELQSTDRSSFGRRYGGLTLQRK